MNQNAGRANWPPARTGRTAGPGIFQCPVVEGNRERHVGLGRRNLKEFKQPIRFGVCTRHDRSDIDRNAMTVQRRSVVFK
jgi:hypothetical protein